MYIRNFYEPKDLFFGNLVTEFGINVQISLSFKTTDCEYDFELYDPRKPFKKNGDWIPVEWDDFYKTLNGNQISRIVINRADGSYHVSFLKGNCELGKIHCKDIKGLPEM